MDDSLYFTNDERARWYNPVLIFEIVDESNEIRERRKGLEAAWTMFQTNPTFFSWYQEYQEQEQAQAQAQAEASGSGNASCA